MEFFKIKFWKKFTSNFFSLCYPQGYSKVSSKNVSPFGPVIWPAIANIYTHMYKQRACFTDNNINENKVKRRRRIIIKITTKKIQRLR